MKMLLAIVAIAGIFLGIAQNAAVAAPVSLIHARCAPPVASPLKFSIDARGVARATMRLSVTCTQDTPFTVSLVSSNNCMLQAGGQNFHYDIFSDAQMHENVLNCFPGGQAELSGTGSTTFFLYGFALVPSAHLIADVAFQDDIYATVSY